jgi:uncharacterized membrane protein (UPF0127 family)
VRHNALANGFVKKANQLWSPFRGRPRLALALVAVGLAADGCDGQRSPPPPPPAAKTVADYFTVRVGGRAVRMQVAVTTPEMERGLMERTRLGADDGMLFVYPSPQAMSFWMHDTPTPLDERPVSSRSKELQYALEMNQGWFSAQGVRPGAKLDLAAVKAALAARGFEPERFGLR